MKTICPGCKKGCFFEPVAVQFIDDEDWPLLEKVMAGRIFLLEDKHAWLMLNCSDCGTTRSHASLGISNNDAKTLGETLQ